MFVDGSNLYGGICDLLKPGEYFDFDNFIKQIETKFKLDKIIFYATYSQKTLKHSQKIIKQIKTQKLFFDSVKNCQKVDFYEGHFSGSGKEKGVDVHLAIDMALGSCLKQYNEAIIFTGDADLLYAVEKATELGSRVHMACISSRFPYALFYKTGYKLIFDYDNFFNKKIKPKLKIKPKNEKYIKILKLTAKMIIKNA